MHSHLDIQLNKQSMTLTEDFSIDVTEENPLFNDNGMYSTPVQVPMEGNRHVLRNLDDPNSDLRPIAMEHTEADINVSGLPFRHGTVVIQEGEELKDSFSFNIDESTQSFSDLIGDLKCQDVPLYNNEKIPIGQKICDVNLSMDVEMDIRVEFIETHWGYVNNELFNYDPAITGKFDPQALGFSCPGIYSSSSAKAYPNVGTIKKPVYSKSYINVSEPYESDDDIPGAPAAGGWRYCNARVCYTHYGLDTGKAIADSKTQAGKNITGTIGETTSEVEKVGNQYGVNEDYGPYWVLDADRPQSGICFYVLYFLDCLFNHLGVSFDNSALTAIEDLRRLAFFTTKCKYVVDTDSPDDTISSLVDINEWLEKRGCGGAIEFPDAEEKSVEDVTVPGVGRFQKGKPFLNAPDTEIKSIKTYGTVHRVDATAKVCTMYATSENFPDESVKTILDSLEASFGVRFRYDYHLRKVTAYLLRDVFRKKDHKGRALEPVTLPCTVLEVNKLSEKITGVRMKYSAEGEATDQQRNVRTGKRDYDTDFDYIDYREGRTQVSTGYKSIASDLRTENVTCYVDLNTANAYRFKISKDVDSANVAYHRLFEVGAFKGIEVGDCSPQNNDFVKELVSNFQPMSFNDVNAYAEMKLGKTQSILAAYVDEDMEHEFVTQKINHPIYSDICDIYATEVLRLIESYDPSKTDDGNSPLQEYDWGLAIAIMRGGGTDASVENFDRNYDGFDNSRWRTQVGTYAMASDTMDQFGNTFDYNGQGSNGEDNGNGGGERFSLKIRSYKPFLYYTDAAGKTHVTSDLSLEGQPVDSDSGKVWLIPSNGDAVVDRRGLADVFMAEYIWFLLHRKAYRIHLLAEPAALIDIPNHWDNLFKIGDKIGYIDKLNYTVDVQKGIGEVTVDFFEV